MAALSAQILTGAASINTSYYLLKSAADQILPAAFRHYLTSLLQGVSNRFSSQLITVVIHEYDGGITYNHRFAAVKTYLGSKISPSTRRIKVSQPVKEVDRDVITLDKDEEVTDSFDGIPLTWVVKSATVDSPEYRSRKEERSFELTFGKKHKDLVLNVYLPFIAKESDRINEETKVLNLHTYTDMYDWSAVALTHPSSFETVAMEPEAKTELIKDLDNFIGRKDYYNRVGKAWKRGYLLYGPPGTGKSSLVAAIAKYLNFDIYDLDLKSVKNNSELLELLVRFENKSILVIEDIDRCGIKLDNDDTKESNDRGSSRTFGSEEEITMSGLLNFIDGLWSSCGEERIIVFTTNHKEKLDPALLRPGRMDVHIEMSYCKFGSFKTLARNYLKVEDHKLFGEIEVLLSEVEVSPADVAGQLMKSDDADIALQNLVKYLTSNKTLESKEKEEGAKTPESQVEVANPAQDHKLKVGVGKLRKKKTRRLRKYKLEILVKHL